MWPHTDYKTILIQIYMILYTNKTIYRLKVKIQVICGKIKMFLSVCGQILEQVERLLVVG